MNGEVFREKVRGSDGDIDINAGAIITEDKTLEAMGEESIKYLMKVCCGELSVPGKKNYGGVMCVFSASTPV